MVAVVESYGKDRDKEEAVDANLLLILTLFVRNFNVCEQGMLLDRNSKMFHKCSRCQSFCQNSQIRFSMDQTSYVYILDIITDINSGNPLFCLYGIPNYVVLLYFTTQA